MKNRRPNRSVQALRESRSLPVSAAPCKHKSRSSTGCAPAFWSCDGLFLDAYERPWSGRESGTSVQARLLDQWVRTVAEHCLGVGVSLVIRGRDRITPQAGVRMDRSDIAERLVALQGASRIRGIMAAKLRDIGTPP